MNLVDVLFSVSPLSPDLIVNYLDWAQKSKKKKKKKIKVDLTTCRQDGCAIDGCKEIFALAFFKGLVHCLGCFGYPYV